METTLPHCFHYWLIINKVTNDEWCFNTYCQFNQPVGLGFERILLQMAKNQLAFYNIEVIKYISNF